MILIVGSTGVLGDETARQLLAAGHKVRAMARDPGKAADLQQLGAEVVPGDLIDYASLARACAGAEKVLAAAHSLLGTGKYRSEAVDDRGHRALIDAAKAAGVKHFVYTSARGAGPNHPTDFFRTKYTIEQYLVSSGLSHTILRPSAFMEHHVHLFIGKEILEKGAATIYGAGDNPHNFVAGRDVARFAVIALTDPKAKGQVMDIGGPDNPTKNQVAEMYARLSGRTPKVSHVPTAMMRFMSPLLRPIQPVLSRLMSFSAWADTDKDMAFDPAAMLKDYPMELVRVEDFVRARVAEAGVPAAAQPATA
jgi:uncharacterized protein YbjT (DUF2867 family)